MKREFLQNLKVGDMPLSKEVIDAIMEENGKDINAAKTIAVKPYADYETIRQENERLKDQAALAEGKSAAQWKEAYDQAAADYETRLAGITFQNALEQAVCAAGGRNVKAITALLDLDALQAAEDSSDALKIALDNLKQQEGYLFTEPTPPPYARGTGTRTRETAPTTLAGALREKFERK